MNKILIVIALLGLLLVSGCGNEELVEEKPKHCLWVCISIDGTNFTNIQGCGDTIKKIPSMSTCAEFRGEFINLFETNKSNEIECNVLIYSNGTAIFTPESCKLKPNYGFIEFDLNKLPPRSKMWNITYSLINETKE